MSELRRTMSRRKQDNPRIADRPDTGNLAVARGRWACCTMHCPAHSDGYMLDPAFIPDPDQRATYQAKLHAWYSALDPKGRLFLGPLWHRICTGKHQPAAANRTRTATEPPTD
jgi:hypothetical protein